MNETTVSIIEEPVAAGRNPRRSVLSRARQDRDGMLRFVRDPQGQVVFDVDAKLPGRGFWLEADRASVELAVKRQALTRAAGPGSSVTGDLAAQIEDILVRRGLDRIGLARRAGALVGGFDEVERTLRAGRAVMLIQALDAADDGLQKLGRLATKLSVVRLFDRTELGRALGRSEAVHLAVTHESHAASLMTIVRRLAGFRQGPTDRSADSTVTSTERQERLAS
ncbi:MAG TPA: DUF448 domain-containing protein [Geminicoccus sp.]|uniref:DUF448 domain-containing protein n=1 Tax=Geminicoccus sp. TaxID=2024832 RepID=UPI002E2EF45E|nr:DUF448 domain-containing protein [Geminicoccus sp.]HEX2526254.1 DUF448 domain-containing protein [Geminicoccus sp.]